MLVHDFVELEVGIDDVVALLTGAPDEIGVWAQAAYRRGERLAVGVADGLVAAPVRIFVGTPLRGIESVSIPLTWTAASDVLFPSMEAEIVVSPLGPRLSYLEFRGSYSPPLDGFGALLDRLVFHRIAESTVRSFLERLAEAVRAEVKG